MKQKKHQENRQQYIASILIGMLLFIAAFIQCSSEIEKSNRGIEKITFECNAINSIPNKLVCPNFGKISVAVIEKYPAGGDIYEKDYCVQGKNTVSRITENYIVDVKSFNSEYLFDSFLYVYDTVCGGKPPFFAEIEFAKKIVSEAKKEDRKKFTDTVRLRSGKTLLGVKATVTKDSVVVVDVNGNASVYRKSEVHSVDR